MSVSVFAFVSKVIASNLPDRLKIPIRNLVDQLGVPLTMYRFCITISGSVFSRFAIFIAITQSGILL